MAQLGCRCTQGLWFKGWGIVSPTLLRPNKAWHWPLMCHSKPEVMGAAWLRDSLSLVFFSNYCLLTPSSTPLWLMLGSVCDSLQSGLTAGGRAKLEQRGLSIPGNMGSPAVSWLLMALSTLRSLLSYCVSYAFDFLLINMLNICVSEIQMPLQIQVKLRTRLICLTFKIANYFFKQQNFNFGLCKNTYFHNCPY